MPARPPFALSSRSLALCLALACCGLTVTAFAESSTPAVKIPFDIPAGPLDQALNAFGRHAGLLVGYQPQQTAGRRSPGLRGDHDVASGLTLLLADSGLRAVAAEGGYRLEDMATVNDAGVTDLSDSTVVGDWLSDAKQSAVFEHPGARDVLRHEDFARTGAATAREALNRIPGVNAPENNGTGSHDLALNFGIRGLNPRLATRSTVLMDGIPVPFAPYGQPQLSLAPVTLGNMDAVDVVRGGGAVRYGPQNVGGVLNFVTRAIPKDFSLKGGVQTEVSPSSSQDGFKKTGNLLVGGTADNGLGGALLYSGTRGGDYRERSDTRIDDLILKGKYQIDEANSVHSIAQYYDGEAEMPGGLSSAAFDADPYQSTRPLDSFWGRRTLFGAGYDHAQDNRQFSVNAFFTKTLRSGFLDQGTFVSMSPREYWVRGVETRFSQGFAMGDSWHEVGVGYRYVSEASHELRYRTPIGTGLPTSASRKDRDTRGQTEAHAFYLDDRIDIGRWTFTPGIRYEIIDQQQTNLLSQTPYQGNYREALPALNVLYHLTDHWNLYGNTEGSFGSVQYNQMPNRVSQGEVEPEKARTWELGTRYDDGALKAELGAFLINFNNQYDSNQTNDSVIARGKTRHQGIETSLAWRLGALTPALADFDVYANYAYIDARILESGPNQGNRVPFSSRHKGLLGLGYSHAHWRLDLDTQFQSAQFADNANTIAESADGSTGRIPCYATWNTRAAYDFGPQLANLKVAVGVKNLFDREYYTRSFDDNNKGKYLGQPRTLYLQTSVEF